MKKAIKFLFFFFFLIGLILLNFAVSYIFKFPFSKINIIFAFIMFYMFWKETGIAVWFSFILHFLNELYAGTQFGILLAAGTLSILLSFWMFKMIFSNKSVYSIFVLSIITMLLYRIIYLILAGIISAISAQQYVFEWTKMLSFFAWENILTSFVTAALYFLIIKIKKPANFIQQGI
jgi:hypothetical protein